MKIAHFYHVYAGGAWAPAAFEHAEALAAAEFPARPQVGIVGEDRDREVVRDWAQAEGWEVVAEAEKGYEQVTLNVLRAWAADAPAGARVLYCHTKGAMNDHQGANTNWRREMTARVVGEWQIIQPLLDRRDAIGCCWKNQAEFPNFMGPETAGHFAGNFWWATAAYLRKLPPVEAGARHKAETWIGRSRPVVADLMPWIVYLLDTGKAITGKTVLPK